MKKEEVKKNENRSLTVLLYLIVISLSILPFIKHIIYYSNGGTMDMMNWLKGSGLAIVILVSFVIILESYIDLLLEEVKKILQ